MNLKDMRIGTQLRLGLGVKMVFVLFLGVLAWITTDHLWLQTKTMHDHPLQVSRAVGKLEAGVNAISRHTRDLFLAPTAQELTSPLQDIEIDKTDAERQLTILNDRYLGPRDDIESLRNELVKWNTLRLETIRMLQAGERAEALARVRPGGVQDMQARAVRSRLQKIDDFAGNKGSELYQAALLQKTTLNQRLAVIVAAIMLLSLYISWRLMRGIKTPLKQLTSAAEQFRQGDMDVRCEYASPNEIGVLSKAFNTMAETVELQMHLNEQTAQLAAVMVRETEVHTFCREVLKDLLKSTGSQIGAIYLFNPQKAEYEHFESIGLDTGGRAAFSATAHEGEFGAALATGRMQVISDIPADSRFSFATVAGDFKPREIITIPLISDHRAGAMLSLASLRGYAKRTISLLEEVLPIMTARMNSVLAYREIQDLAERLNHQNRELEMQKQELAAQSSELTEQNTELELQKQQLDEANRLKSAFLSNMSHELRTPLNSVIALSGVLNRRLAGKIPEDEYGYLDVIERNGKQLLALINDILDLSRIEAGREEVNSNRFSMRALVEDVVAMLESQAREKEIALLNLVGDDLPQIVSDYAKCRHILQNLVANAVKFTEAGSVEISAGQVGDKLQVAVRDTGIGIASEQLPHIFEEFRQADDSTSRKYGGTGLGLAIVRKYAALLHGRVRVESTPGTGSTFTLVLPLALALSANDATEKSSHRNFAAVAAAGRGPISGQGGCILLVEDSEPAVIQINDILHEQGYEVRVAHNGREALAQIETAPVDAMILDLMMPEMDGFEVLRQIRSREGSRHLPVLILTAKHVTREELSFLTGNHVHQLIQKGEVSRTELLNAVEKMVSAPQDKIAYPVRPQTCIISPGDHVILAVEDNPDNMHTMRALLQDTCTLLEAVNGRDAVEVARLHAPNLILMDIAMPVMNGFEALEALRNDPALQHIPVVAVTASAMTGNREEILAHGFDGYISKPIDENQLRNTIREVLNGNRRIEDTGD
jgi:signal transduction histidine kinase/CheY-like chemotaxis protein/HAMP domain-containing protein